MFPRLFRPWSWSRRRVLLAAGFALGLVLARSQLRTVLYSVYFLGGLANLGQPTWLDPLLAYPVGMAHADTRLPDGERLELHVYRPQGPGPWPALLIVPGFDKLGLEDPRMIGLARLVAGAGVVVVMPVLTELFEYRWSARLTDRVESAFLFMAAQPGVRPEQLGIFGISVSGAFALASATRPAVAQRLSYFIAFAPFHEYTNILEFGFTGRYRYGTETIQRAPSPFIHWILLYNFLQLALDPGDPEFPSAREVIRLRIYEQGEAADRLAAGLSDATRGLLARLESDPATLSELSRKAIEDGEAISRVLSPQWNLCNLEGRLFILHGSDDDVIPYTESLQMAEHCKSCPALRCDVLVTGLYTHADMDTPFQGLWHRLRYQVPEMARYYAFLYRVLRCMLA